MPQIIKNTILGYIPPVFEVEHNVKSERIYNFNNEPLKNGYVVYLCEREIRFKDNFSLSFAITKSKELDLPLKIIHPSVSYDVKLKQDFINRQIKQAESGFKEFGFDFEIIPQTEIKEFLKKLKIGCMIIDFNPISEHSYLKTFDFKIYEVDSHNIIPARYVSDKQEYNAATFRRKVYSKIYPFLTESKNETDLRVEGDYALDDFIKNRLFDYTRYKNDPTKDVLSGMSKYLNLGFVSSRRAALEVIKSDVSGDNKEAFLEELIVRKELSDNFCLYNKNFKTLSGIPNWAKISLKEHEKDIRSYIYTLDDFESANTHDYLWNATQRQLIKEGIIHGYLRMYWAKKILEWTNSPQDALNIAIYLNDKYAYDSPSPSGYVNILWSIGALHDRAFKDSFVTGKIRRMSYTGMKSKFNVNKYISSHFI